MFDQKIIISLIERLNSIILYSGKEYNLFKI